MNETIEVNGERIDSVDAVSSNDDSEFLGNSVHDKDGVHHDHDDCDDGDDSGDDERGGRLSKNLSSSSLEEIYSKLQIVDSPIGGSIPVDET